MILVTGGTGLVGGNLLWHLLQENDKVTAIRRSTSKIESLRTIFSFYTTTPERFLERIDWIVADVLDENSILKAMTHATIVYHCAAMVSLGNNDDILQHTNVIGTRNIVNACIQNNINKLCFVSSIAACGKSIIGEHIDENSFWEDSSIQSTYSRSKYYSEQEVWKGIQKGLNAVIVNPGVILGVSGSNAGSSKLFSQIQKGMIFYTLGGSGYVDVQDVVKVMIQLTNSSISRERFILVAENCSNKDILNWIADGFKKNHPFIRVGKRALWAVGIVSEFFGKLFNFQPLIDRGTAKSAINRNYYSSKKITNSISYKFTPVKDCIKDVCLYLSNE
ncbi:MAG: NAD-dependent epimerase/dehydratase family protein [Paludibacter sp.]|nr:NAD-dependent epimerase/dehydratase family protein [Paludibacter sp.]